mgnify:CR=1 FL=1
MNYPVVLTIAGSDSCGGAGIQADIKAIQATGSYAASAITAVTVQNTSGVQAVHTVPTEIVRGQIRAVLTDIGADAIKIGMLASRELVLTVRDAINAINGDRSFDIERSNDLSPLIFPTIVLDPVMVATSGDRLIEESAVETLKNELVPYARVLTPNIPEAEILAGMSISGQSDLPDAARLISKTVSTLPGRKVSVLMKAGHLENDMLVDYFYNAEEDHIIELPAKRVESRNTHGTGCTLSSALASYLAQGLSLDDAVRAAKRYIARAIEAGSRYEIGHGHGPVDHFFMLH